ncbi:methyltransferase [Candidatus Endobugula sertula]|uniref:Methyltransferase n=1 Tax=Candidatus Endobugula sertula TaxID=62101 RepID=A0A1D2QQ06_9GAMM|nr:methyltransferase [Candidatus Endobugula sertula]
MKKSTIKYPTGWVPESAFGIWFLNTDIWIHHVLKLSLDALEEVMFPKHERYPTILDIGCGHGNSLVQLDKRFKPDKMFGVDVDPEVIKRSKDNIQRCQSDIEIMINNAASINLPDNAVDMIFCHQTFHHLIDQESAIQEFYRLLKPGGVLLFAESCRRYIHSLVIKVLFRHPMDMQKTDEEYLELIRTAGFIYQPENVSKPFLWWSRADLGLLEKIGWKSAKDREGTREETLVYLAAYKPE